MKLPLLFGLIMAAACSCSAEKGTFASQLFQLISSQADDRNVIISPASIQTCLAMSYLGAAGETANELKNGLQLDGSSKQEIAENFVGKLKELTKADSKLKMANRIFVNQQYEILDKFNELAAKHFNAAAESINFADSSKAADTINKWVEQQTDNKIQNLIESSALDVSTAAVLVNALYFKAKWRNAFDGFATNKNVFYLKSGQKIDVDTMYQTDDFLYGELKDLDAKAIELAYVKSDIRMLIILPNKRDGLTELESKLKQVDLTKLSAQMREENVNLQLPKFKIEFDLSLQSVLEKLGIKNMFTDSANFSEMISGEKNLSISEVKHKAFIEVNEAGTEASAATYAKAVLLSYIIGQVTYEFKVDHPFFFALKDDNMVYFAGHITTF